MYTLLNLRQYNMNINTILPSFIVTIITNNIKIFLSDFFQLFSNPLSKSYFTLKTFPVWCGCCSWIISRSFLFSDAILNAPVLQVLILILLFRVVSFLSVSIIFREYINRKDYVCILETMQPISTGSQLYSELMCE